MLFNSQEFVLFFLPTVFGLFLYLWHRGWSRAAINFLTLASLFFYGWWNVSYLPLIIGSILTNFLIAGAITRLFQTGRGQHRPVLTLGIAFNLMLLGYFKYANFFVDTLNVVAGTEFHLAKIVLPLAISFFTFQQVSFLVDTWKKKGHRYSFESYAAYLTFFPHEIAGPIIRHHELIPQFALNPWRDGLWERIGRGLTLFAIGLVKKVFIADVMAGIVSPIFLAASKTGTLSALDAWVGTIGFAWQIFFDFSAYTDMALGVALLFGYKLPINFDCPYRSTSIRELWQRWHMTLSRFLRDYLFVPLATSKWLPFPRFTGMVITMFLAGLWHGASWNFAVWGLLQGFGLALYTLIDRRFRGNLPALLGWVLTMLFWFEGGPLFRGDSFGTALVFYKAMHGGGAPVTAVNWHDLGLLAMAALVAILGPSSQAVAFERLQPSWRAALAAGAAVFVALFVIGSGVEQEFIYFQF
jgi:alginate O-acetyltransferase complex protein AlgI